MTRNAEPPSADPRPRQPAGPPLRVLLADPDPIARGAARWALSAARGFELISEATSVRDAVDLVITHRPDAALLEVGASATETLLVIRQILDRAPGVHAVLYSADADEELQIQALQIGARGVIDKRQGVVWLVRALAVVARGEVAIPRDLTPRLVERVRRLPAHARGVRPVDSSLTDREWEVIDLLSRGATPSEVADALNLTRETVYRHVKNAMRKLGVHRQADLLRVTDIARQTPPHGPS